MLQLSARLINRPVLSLRTGTQVATANYPIINPNNLKVEGFYCQDRFKKKQELILLYQDIRDVLAQGIVINDYEVLTEPSEIVRLKDIMDLKFEIIGKSVVTVSKTKVGKVSDFATEVETMYIQKLYVSQSLVKNLKGGSLSIDRSQIVEITNRRIVIQDILKPSPIQAAASAA